MNKKYGWAMNVLGIICVVSGNQDSGTTCFCTALILFSIKQ